MAKSPADLYFDSSIVTVQLRINGQLARDIKMEHGFAVINRVWKKGDKIELNIPIFVNEVYANKNLADDIGKVAIQRGPLMYVAEWVDNNGKAANIILPEETRFSSSFDEKLLGGVVVLKSKVPAVHVSNDGLSVTSSPQDFTAIPYYAWANRGPGEMMMWFPQKIKDIDIITK
jgi:hypothetical protein